MLGINVALGQMATQRQDLNYNGFAWSADKAIDGCYSRDNPDISRCCSCSEEVDPGDNFWQLTFSQTQRLMKINVFGRGGNQYIMIFQFFFINMGYIFIDWYENKYGNFHTTR